LQDSCQELNWPKHDFKSRFYWNIRNLYQTELNLLLNLVLPGFTYRICLRSHCVIVSRLSYKFIVNLNIYKYRNNIEGTRTVYLEVLKLRKDLYTYSFTFITKGGVREIFIYIQLIIQNHTSHILSFSLIHSTMTNI